MPIYQPITNVMPVASMVSGAAVSAALCDQIRDNMVALWEGWWFRATRAATLSTAVAGSTVVPLTSITQSATSVAEGSIALTSGWVTTTKPGLWLIGGQAVYSGTTTLVDVFLTSTNMPGPSSLCEDINDSTGVKAGSSAAASVNVTSATNEFKLWVFSTAGVTLTTSPMNCMWGVWLGGNP